MAIWAFLRKSIEKPCFCPFWRILGIGTFFIWGGLWAVPRQKMDSKKASCSKRSQKHDLSHNRFPTPPKNIPVAPKRAKIGEKGVKKGGFRSIDLGPLGGQKDFWGANKCPKTTQETKLDRFDHPKKTSKSDPRFDTFGKKLPGNCPFFLAVAFKPKIAISKGAQLAQNGVILAEI